MVQKETLKNIYGDRWEKAQARFTELEKKFAEKFGSARPTMFSSPGRTEIVGNHVDHNGGRILAASIDMDTIAAAAVNASSVITIISEGYPLPVIIDLKKLDEVPVCNGTLSLVAGILAAAKKYGYKAGGFDAYVSTEVISSAGISSSASFEMLICAILNEFFNNGSLNCAQYARMGRYAENVYWKKASGLMDQMACAVGGTILLDFGAGDVRYEKVDFDFESLGYDEVIINTGKGHADLSAEYSSVPDEMHAVAREFGKENLCDVSEAEVINRLPELRRKMGNDRAILRVLHYYEECRRVDEAVAALKNGHKQEILRIMNDSGHSSWEWLQNCYVPGSPCEQPISMALALARIWFREKGSGIARVHGGGFAGVIMCVVPKTETEGFIRFMSGVFGKNNIYVAAIRSTGAVTVK